MRPAFTALLSSEALKASVCSVRALKALSSGGVLTGLKNKNKHKRETQNQKPK